MIKEVSHMHTDLPNYLLHIEPAVMKRLPYHPLVNGNVWKVLSKYKMMLRCIVVLYFMLICLIFSPENELDVKTFRTLQPVASLLEVMYLYFSLF